MGIDAVKKLRQHHKLNKVGTHTKMIRLLLHLQPFLYHSHTLGDDKSSRRLAFGSDSEGMEEQNCLYLSLSEKELEANADFGVSSFKGDFVVQVNMLQSLCQDKARDKYAPLVDNIVAAAKQIREEVRGTIRTQSQSCTILQPACKFICLATDSEITLQVIRFASIADSIVKLQNDHTKKEQFKSL